MDRMGVRLKARQDTGLWVSERASQRDAEPKAETIDQIGYSDKSRSSVRLTLAIVIQYPRSSTGDDAA